MKIRWTLRGQVSEDERARLHRYEAAVARMAPLERAVFLGHVVDGKSLAALAREHALDVADIEALLWRALGALSEMPGD